MAYKHGMYGELLDSISQSVVQSDTVAVYVGSLPVHLVRGYREKNLVNHPIKVSSFENAKATVGYSENWKDFTLCEAIHAHLSNTVQNAGPIYLINVADPDVLRKGATAKTKTLSFLEGKAAISEQGLIRGSILVEGLEEGVDYELFYDEEGAVLSVLQAILEPIEVSYQSAPPENVTLQFVNGQAVLNDDCIILDTLALEGMIEGVDYILDYNYTKGQAVIQSMNVADPLNALVSASYYAVDPTKITEDDIIGGKTAKGVTSGITAIKLVYQELYVVPNILSVPKWSMLPKVYNAMASAVQNINGRWSAFFNADLPLQDETGNIDTKEKAIRWKKSHSFSSERSKVCWPQWRLSDGHTYHLSTICTWRMLLTDSQNGNIPYISPSNESIPAGRPFFGESSTNMGYDEEEANELNEQGITTVNQDAGQWALWGPHTAAYMYGSEIDPRGIFDVNIRMLFWAMNGFIRRHKKEIDEPMTLGRKDSILNQEQSILNGLQGRGILLGNPKIFFTETKNPKENLMNGDFYWDMTITNVPPFKSGTLGVAYTDEGFSAYYEEG